MKFTLLTECNTLNYRFLPLYKVEKAGGKMPKVYANSVHDYKQPKGPEVVLSLK